LTSQWHKSIVGLVRKVLTGKEEMKVRKEMTLTVCDYVMKPIVELAELDAFSIETAQNVARVISMDLYTFNEMLKLRKEIQGIPNYDADPIKRQIREAYKSAQASS
jgi:hypothetical protein